MIQFASQKTWRRQWHPTPVFLPGESHRQRSLVGCSPWDLEESDTTERLHFHFSLSCIGEGNGNLLVFLPGESRGQGSLVGCRLWGCTELDTTEATQQQQSKNLYYCSKCSLVQFLTTLIITMNFHSHPNFDFGAFPGSPVVRIPWFHSIEWGPGFDPWSGNYDPTSFEWETKNKF